MKRKQCEESLRCNVVRGRGLEVYWRLDNVREMLMSGLPVTSEWLEMGGLVVELLLQPLRGQSTLGLLFSALDGHDGKNLPAAVRFQVINQIDPSMCATLEEGRGVLRVGRSSWATEELIPLAALHDPGMGWVVADQLTIRVEAQYP